MLFAWSGATVFQAGPSKAMNWYGTDGTGSQESAGPRADDTDAMCGNAVMYDATAGKILVTGGSIDYVDLPASVPASVPQTYKETLAHIPTAKRQRDGKRSHYHNRHPNDCTHRPNNQLHVLSPNIRQRHRPPNRHSLDHRRPTIRHPLLRQRQLPPTRTLGPRLHQLHQSRPPIHPPQLSLHRHPPPGRNRSLCRRRLVRRLCGEPLRRPDIQPGLPVYRQWRPSDQTRHHIRYRKSRRWRNANGNHRLRRHGLGSAETRRYNAYVLPLLNETTSNDFSRFLAGRANPCTHAQIDTVHTDQRRIPLTATAGTGAANDYSMTLPTDPGVVIPGYYYLFAMNAAGVPSVATFVQVPVP